MRYIVFHLSVTSFDDGTPAEKSETIALGVLESARAVARLARELV